MANTKAQDSREKAKDQESIEEMVGQRGQHVTGQQLGNVNREGIAPLTEQEKRNRGESHAATGGEAATRGDGVETRPSESKSERLHADDEDRPRTSRNASEVRPSHP
jgi:hypothetical protein